MERHVMNILCSGNPTHQTVASAISKTFPDAHFASRATGYDLRLLDLKNESYFRNRIINYNVFINSSFIAVDVQLKLLEITYQEWMRADIKGHIVNIGSTAENSNNQQYANYVKSKRLLRKRSLELNEESGISGVRTTHAIVDGINDGKSEHANWLDLNHVAAAIGWVLSQPYNIPLLQLENRK
jgi:hypothetical protein